MHVYVREWVLDVCVMSEQDEAPRVHVSPCDIWPSLSWSPVQPHCSGRQQLPGA